MKKVYFLTLGCPKNEVDSENFAGCFIRSGWSITSDPDQADLIFLNTCAFIKPAVEESLECIQDLLDWKIQKNDRKLILAGCLPGRYKQDGKEGLEEFAMVIGPGDVSALQEFLGLKKEKIFAVELNTRVSRYLKIAEGCSNYCSYCMIPYIRGEFIPYPSAEIIESAELLVKQGAREIGIIAQDPCMWEWQGRNFLSLLEDLCRLFPDIWWRTYYLHPHHFPYGILKLMEKRQNLVPYLDLPIQHADDEILSRMGRGYTGSEIRNILDAVENTGFPVAVRTTVIVGYPGEEKNSFGKLRALLEEYECFRHLLAFPYYNEEGTKEFLRTGNEYEQPKDDVVRERLNNLSIISDLFYERWRQRLTGTEIGVLLDAPDMGHSAFDAPIVDGVCHFSESAGKPGDIVKASVEHCTGADMLVRKSDSEELT